VVQQVEQAPRDAIGGLSMLINSSHKATRPLDLLLVPLPNCAAALNEFRRCPNEEPDPGAQLGGELVRGDGAPVAPATRDRRAQ